MEPIELKYEFIDNTSEFYIPNRLTCAKFSIFINGVNITESKHKTKDEYYSQIEIPLFPIAVCLIDYWKFMFSRDRDYKERINTHDESRMCKWTHCLKYADVLSPIPSLEIYSCKDTTYYLCDEIDDVKYFDIKFTNMNRAEHNKKSAMILWAKFIDDILEKITSNIDIKTEPKIMDIDRGILKKWDKIKKKFQI